MNRVALIYLFIFCFIFLTTGCTNNQSAGEPDQIAQAATSPPTEAAEPTVKATAEVVDRSTATFTPISATATSTLTPPPPTREEPAKPTLKPTATDTPTPVATDTPTSTPTATATATIDPASLVTDTPFPPPPIPIPELNLAPGSPQPYLSKFTLLTYYGTPNGPSLGILGAQARFYTNNELRNLRRDYQPLVAGDKFVIPTYHIITSVADNFPGANGDYNHWLDWGIIQDWIAEADRLGYAVILDIQPGQNDLMEEFDRVWGLLYNPHVHLALDPEFVMDPGEVPGEHLGQMRAEDINAIQARMNGIGFEIGLNRVLILHQFEDSMLPDKANIQGYPFVELVIDADGFGSPGSKISDYNQYAVEPGFEYGGLKLFYQFDSPLMSPRDVMSLSPQPAVIIYQ